MNILLENVCLKYGETTLFNNLNYSFHHGIYLIRGKSGVGKTTLLNLIMGYINPDKGTISKTDVNLSYVMQETMLFNNLTVKENFYIKYRLNPEFTESRLNEMMIERIRNIGLPDNVIDKKVSLLSGGQKRKFELLLQSVSPSNVILLDEPVANLDKESIMQVVSFIESNLSQERLVIISSHIHMDFNAQVVQLVLEDGKLKADQAWKGEQDEI